MTNSPRYSMPNGFCKNGGTFSVKEDKSGADVKEILFEYHGQNRNAIICNSLNL